MKRVRKLYDHSCLQILNLRRAAIEALQLQWNSLPEYQDLVKKLESDHGVPWCRQRAFVAFPHAGFRFSVVMPVFNEVKTIEEMIRRVAAVDLPMELVVVDDGSTDGTSKVLKELVAKDRLQVGNAFGNVSVTVLFHDTNRGKGAALKTGFQATSGDVVGIQDADREYNPQEFIGLISTLVLNEADVVYGSRFAKPMVSNDQDPSDDHPLESSQSKESAELTHSPAWHRFGNGLITQLSNLRTGLNLTDAETCYKLIRKSVLDPLVEGLKETRFGIELEMTAKLARQKDLRFDERPISYDKRTYAEGKKIGIRDGFRAMWCILKY